MSRTSRLVLILYLVSTVSLAQVSLRDSALVPLEANCPIDMRATLEKSGNLQAAQRLQVTLTKWSAVAIVASRITVHGMAPVANSPEHSEIAESLDLIRIVNHPRPNTSTGNVPHAFTENELPWLQAEPVIIVSSTSPSRWYAWVSGFTALNFIDLDSVSYADGTTWHASNGKTCRVAVGSSMW
jgi:hypothetical protein